MSFLKFLRRQLLQEPPIPNISFKGRTVIVTGANSGLGLEASRSIVRLGASHVILACRNVDKGRAAAEDIRTSTACPPDVLEVWSLDMNSYASVLAFADRARTELPRLDALVANAAIGALTFRKTEDNEESITANVVSTSLLGLLLLPKLRNTAAEHRVQTHITITGSELYEVAVFKERLAPEGHIFANLNGETTANMADRYNVTKLLVLLFLRQVAAMSPLRPNNVIINCVAPGFCYSNLGSRDLNDIGGFGRRAFVVFRALFARKTEVGARTLVYGASAGPQTHGQYLPDCKITPLGGLCKGKEGDALQARVWAELREKLEAIQPGVTSLN